MEDVFRLADEFGPVRIIHIHRPHVGLKAIAVIDNTACGCAIGGVRMAPDASTEECFRLARAMTWKNAAAGLPHGGAKSVILADPKLPAEQKECLVRAFAGGIAKSFFPLVSLINAADFMAGPLQIVVVGTRGDAAADALVRTVLDRSLPDRVLTVLAPGGALPEGHPAHGKAQVRGKPTAYVCEGPICSLPVTDPAALAALLEKS